jgi:predicted amidohydrolase YtcJ
MAGITADTPDPPGGMIERDLSGRATGVLRDEAVWSRLAAGVVAPRNRFRQLAELRDLLADLAGRGITEVHDIGTYPRQDTLVPFHEERSFTDVGLIDELDRRAELSLRYSYRASLLRVSEYDDLVAPRPDGSALMEFGGFKMSLDNGWFSQPAGPRVDSFRYPGCSEASKLIDQADRVDAAVSIHAIGDLGVGEALDVLATVGSRRGTDRLPHRVIHARRISPDDITRCAELGVALEMQPWEIVAQGQRMAARGNADFASGISAFASMIEAGCLLTFGSDRRLGLRLDQRDTDPILAVQLAVTRQHPDRPDDPVWQPGQRITLDQALRSATQAGAVAAGAGARRGLIGIGRQADLVVLDADPRQVPTDQIEKVRPLLTVSAGRPVFDRISGGEFR